jgi:Domain of unknown function (DUF4783)
MKKNLLFVALIVNFVAFSSFKKVGPIDDVIEAIKNSNSILLSNYFDNTIDIALPDKNDSYSKAQAQIVVKDFFNVNTVKDFIANHRGNNNGGYYCIGTLSTNKGNFRVTFYMKQKSGKSVLQEIRIENQ